MALKAQYELPDKTILPEAYIRVQNILLSNEDHELLEPVSDDPDSDLKVTWVTRPIANANIYVWADELCRLNRVPPVHWYWLEFTPDLNSTDNFYKQAYSILKSRIDNAQDC